MTSRRELIVDAAESLIRKHGHCDFTMADLAKAAHVSRATTFNLFQSKMVVLYALLNRSLDRVSDEVKRASEDPDPYLQVMRSAQEVARLFVDDSAFYRTLYPVLLGVSDPVNRPAFMKRAMTYWMRSLQGLSDRKLFTDAISREELALGLMSMYLGVLGLWVHGEIDDQEFISRGAFCALSLTLAVAPAKDRTHVTTLMTKCRKGHWKTPLIGASKGNSPR